MTQKPPDLENTHETSYALRVVSHYLRTTPRPRIRILGFLDDEVRTTAPRKWKSWWRFTWAPKHYDEIIRHTRIWGRLWWKEKKDE